MKHLRRLLPYLRRHRRALAGGIACLLVTTALSVASPWVLRYAVDDLTRALTRSKLLLYAGTLVGLVLVEGVFRYFMRLVLISTSRDIEYELRDDVFAHLTRLSAGYYHRHRVGDIMSRATNDLSAVRMVLGPGIMYTANTAATFVFAVALMASISWPLLLLSLLPLLAVSVLVRHFGRKIHDRFERVQGQLSDISAQVQENLAGARVVRAYGQQAQEERRFAEANEEYLRRSRDLIRVFGSLYPGIQLLMGAGAALVLWLGGSLVVAGRISLGEFVAFGVYLTMLHWPMIALGWVVNLFERGEASMGRLLEILDAPPAITDAEAQPAPPLRGEVELRRLTFAYDGPPVLHDITLHVPAGSTVAVVGPTGSGKSTLVSLLARVFDPPPGTLFLDGVDVRRIPLATLRGAVGFVPQETFLFSTTVRENVAFGLRGGQDGAAPSEERLRERTDWAAEVSQLARDLAAFPRGYETVVGERGITLSGGQRQRTALARALAVDPRLLVLDDALSSVDTYTEEEILR
ncbi:MAG TPA: ABC transporter ATP-binding protein, partial [Vicinamibacteria bacterium]|nr:ABC transporter ATP-binding protein [Vicinamibacteria bacterium]